MQPAERQGAPSARRLGRRACEELFLAHLPSIERIARSVARRLDASEREDFVARVRLKLIDDDYAVLARFEGRSRLTTYLTCVVRRQFLDEQVRARGRWRPTARARRAGALAVRAEALVTRDGLTRDEALATLRASVPDVPARTLEALVEDAPAPVTRGLPSASASDAEVACDGGVEARVRGVELRTTARRTRDALARALARLAPDARVLLAEHYVAGRCARRAAQAAGLEPRRAYPCLARALALLRADLAAAGVTRDDARALLSGAAGLDPRELELDWCVTRAVSVRAATRAVSVRAARPPSRPERALATRRAA